MSWRLLSTNELQPYWVRGSLISGNSVVDVRTEWESPYIDGRDFILGGLLRSVSSIIVTRSGSVLGSGFLGLLLEMQRSWCASRPHQYLRQWCHTRAWLPQVLGLRFLSAHWQGGKSTWLTEAPGMISQEGCVAGKQMAAWRCACMHPKRTEGGFSQTKAQHWCLGK